MKTERWKLKNYAPHQRNDVLTHNENVDKGFELCERCEGTGNQFYSMYSKCTACGGTGVKQPTQSPQMPAGRTQTTQD